MPPPLPRPPAWICAFTTKTSPPRARAPSAASCGLAATWPSGTGAPYALSRALAWYSWMFIGSRASRPALAIGFGTLSGGEGRRDPLTQFDQRPDRPDRMHERILLGRREVEFDDALDALGAD